MPSEHFLELEQLLGRLRYAKAGQTNFDMWEQHGARSATAEYRAQMDADLAECNRLYQESQAALEARIATLRAEEPHVVEAWADAHHAYLAWVIAKGFQVDAAGKEQEDWSRVRSGELPFVNENVHYAPESSERYRELFGIALQAF